MRLKRIGQYLCCGAVLKLFLLTVACSSVPEGQTNIQFDVASIRRQAMTSGVTPERAFLNVRGPGIDPDIQIVIDLANPSFDALVPSGPNRLFEIIFVGEVSGTSDGSVSADGTLSSTVLSDAQQALVDEVGGRPLYWGARLVNLAPRATQQLNIQAFKAGLVAGTITRTDAGPLPDDYFFELQVQNDETRRVGLPQLIPVFAEAQGRYLTLLPTGDYGVVASLRAGGQNYSLPSEVRFQLSHGQVISDLNVVLAGADFCDPTNPIDFDDDGIPCDEDCDDTNPHCGPDCTDNDGDLFCTFFDCDDDPTTGGAGCQAVCPTYYRDMDDDGFADTPDTVFSACANPDPTLLSTSANDCSPGDPNLARSDPTMEWFSDNDQDDYFGSVPHIGCNPPANAQPRSNLGDIPNPATFFDCEDNPNGCGDQCFPLNPAGDIPGDGYDNNCNGQVDEPNSITCHQDADGDGFGTDDTSVATVPGSGSCPSGYAANNTDCDDQDDGIHPGASEIPADDVDQNCDRREACFVDRDLDGFGGLPYAADGTLSYELSALDAIHCTGQNAAGEPLSSRGYDCDDSNSALHWIDSDHDGRASCHGDCDDSDASINDKQYEVCNNGTDDDCDGLVDSSDPDCPAGHTDADSDGYPDTIDCDDSDSSVTLLDEDGDGYTDCGSRQNPSATVPIAEEQDCNDDPSNNGDKQNPGRPEKCGDGLDNDCDGATADSCSGIINSDCVDADGDGYLFELVAEACPSNRILDCDDTAADADGDGFPDGRWFNYDDVDGDGYTTCSLNGSPIDPFESDNMAHASGFAPLAAEHCFDGVDNDGDGTIDSADSDCSGNDGDGDGFATGDCDDSVGFEVRTSPEGNAMKACVFDCADYYPDSDDDGYGDQASPAEHTCNFDRTLVNNDLDCNDGASAVSPAALEVCGDAVDNDCSGTIDDLDQDQDGFVAAACLMSSDPLADCNDDPSDGGKHVMPLDLDGDGYLGCDPVGTQDCDDTRVNVNPGMGGDYCESFVNLDNDCDGDIDEDQDFDSDGIGDCDDNCIGVPNSDPTPSQLTIEWIGADCATFSGTHTVYVGTTSLGTLDSNDCSGTSTNSSVFTTNLSSAWLNNKDNVVRLVRTDSGPGEIQWARVLVDGDITGYTPTPSVPQSVGCLIDVGYDLGSNPATACDTGYKPSTAITGTCTDCPSYARAVVDRLPQVEHPSHFGRGPECSNTSAGCSSPSTAEDYEVCGNFVDDDCDGVVDESTLCHKPADCSDGDSDTFYVDAPALVCVLPWGQLDCADADNAVNPGVGSETGPTACADGKDNDCDGRSDLEEFSCQGIMPDANSTTAGRPFDMGILVANTDADESTVEVTGCDIVYARSNVCNGTSSGQSYWVTFRSQVNPAAPQTEDLKLCNNGNHNLWVADFDANASTGAITSETCIPGLSSSLLPQTCVTLSPPDADGDGIDDTTDWSFLVVTDADYGTDCLNKIGVKVKYTGASCAFKDDDFDGHNACVDCDDKDPLIYPGATEVCDFKDNDCDNQVDESVHGTILTSFDFESDPSWTVIPNGASTSWSRVTSTTTGPGQTAFALGSTFYGTDGNQSSSASELEDSTLRTDSIGLGGFSAGSLGLRFDSWTHNADCGSEAPFTDHEILEYSTNGGTSWQAVKGFSEDQCSKPLHESYDGQIRNLGGHLPILTTEPNVQLRFRFDTNDAIDSGSDDGWYIDDLEIYTCPGVILP